MNPNATPFQPAFRVEARAVLEARYKALKLAVVAPLAPIQMLTVAQKQRMQIQPPIFEKNLILPDLQAVFTAISAAEFVLE
jgi:hypothetical protein